MRLHKCLAGAVVFAPARQRCQLPGGDLRIGGIQADHLIRQEAVARAIGRMEVDQVLPGKGTNQRTHLVGVLHGKGWMLHQRLDPLQATRQATGRLDAEPLIHDQRVVFEVLGELGQGLGLFRFERRINQHRQRPQALSHIIAGTILLKAGGQHLRPLTQHQVRQRNVLQATSGKVLGLRHIGGAA